MESGNELLSRVSISDAGVGCVDLMTRPDGDNLGFLVRIYYPTKPYQPDATSNAASMSWFPPEPEYIQGFSEAKRYAQWPLLGRVHSLIRRRKIRKLVQQYRVPVAAEAPLHWQYGTVPLPVFVLSPGIASWCLDAVNVMCSTQSQHPCSRFVHSCLASAFVLHSACVLVVLEHADGSAAWTQRQHAEIRMQPKTVQSAAMTRVRAQELIACCDHLLPAINEGTINTNHNLIYGGSFDWSQFKNRLNVLSVSAIGMGAGAAACLTAVALGCQRIARVVTLDALMSVLDTQLCQHIAESGMPVLFINSEQNTQHQVERRFEFMDLKPNRMKMITILGTKSSNFTDWGRFSGQWLLPMTDERLDPIVCDAVVVQCADDFIRHFSLLWPSDQLSQLMHDYIAVPLSPRLVRSLR